MSQPPPPQQPEDWSQPGQPDQPEQYGQPGPQDPYGATSPYAGQGQPVWGQAPPHPSGTTSEERNWAVAAHAGSFAGFFVGFPLLAPLLVMLVKGKDSGFIRAHAVESLNFQISALIYFIVSVVLAFVLIGFLLLAVLAVFYIIVVILGTMKATEGEMYRYPLTIRMVT